MTLKSLNDELMNGPKKPDNLRAVLLDIFLPNQELIESEWGAGSYEAALEAANEEIDMVMQAFKDAGYVPYPKNQIVALTILVESGDKAKEALIELSSKVVSGELMTGQEWYERFLDELLTIPDEDLSLPRLGMAYREAAKRAAGIE